MTNEILTVPPAAIFIVGALLIPLFRGRVRQSCKTAPTGSSPSWSTN